MSRKRKGPTRGPSRWGPWFTDERSTPGRVLFGNGYWTVLVEAPEGPEGPVHLSIHDRTRSTRHDWRDFQRIKDELVGAEREAFELYPAASRVVDTSNEYHLWVLAAGEAIPVGWVQGKVMDAGQSLEPDEVQQAAERMGMEPEELAAQLTHAKQRPLEKP